jgi:hypothetical protein
VRERERERERERCGWSGAVAITNSSAASNDCMSICPDL